MYELSTGARPFKGESFSAIFNFIIKESPRQIIEVNPSIPRELSQVIIKCLQKAPAERFETGRAVAEALRNCIRKKETAAETTSAIQDKTKKLALLLLLR